MRPRTNIQNGVAIAAYYEKGGAATKYRSSRVDHWPLRFRTCIALKSKMTTLLWKGPVVPEVINYGFEGSKGSIGSAAVASF